MTIRDYGAAGIVYHPDTNKVNQYANVKNNSYISFANPYPTSNTPFSMDFGDGFNFKNNKVYYTGDLASPKSTDLAASITLGGDSSGNTFNIASDYSTHIINNGTGNTIIDNTVNGTLEDDGAAGNNVTFTTTGQGKLTENGLNNIVNFDSSQELQGIGTSPQFILTGQNDQVALNLGDGNLIDLTKGLNNSISLKTTGVSSNSAGANAIKVNAGSQFSLASNGSLVVYDPTTKSTTTIDPNAEAIIYNGDQGTRVDTIIGSLSAHLAGFTYTPPSQTSPSQIASLDQTTGVNGNELTLNRSDYTSSFLNTNLGTTFAFTNSGFNVVGTGSDSATGTGENFNLGSQFTNNHFNLSNDFATQIQNAGSNNSFNIATTLGTMYNFGTNNNIALTTQNGQFGEGGQNDTINVTVNNNSPATDEPAFFTLYNSAKNDNANLSLGNSLADIELTQTVTAPVGNPNTTPADSQSNNSVTIDSGSTNTKLDLDAGYTSTLLSNGDLQINETQTGDTVIVKSGVNVTINGDGTETTAADIIKSLNVSPPAPAPASPAPASPAPASPAPASPAPASPAPASPAPASPAPASPAPASPAPASPAPASPAPASPAPASPAPAASSTNTTNVLFEFVLLFLFRFLGISNR